MLLGLSGDVTQNDLELQTVTGSGNGDGGIAFGSILAALAEAVHDGTVSDEQRNEIVTAVGADGLVDAVAVCANFNMMVRIADGTGTPLDSGSADMTVDLRDELGLEDLTSRRIMDPI